MDVRPLRSDGRHLPVTISDEAYSRERTQALVSTLRRIPGLSGILFNDTAVVGVRWHAGHDNHLHLSFNARKEG